MPLGQARATPQSGRRRAALEKPLAFYKGQRVHYCSRYSLSLPQRAAWALHVQVRIVRREQHAQCCARTAPSQPRRRAADTVTAARRPACSRSSVDFHARQHLPATQSLTITTQGLRDSLWKWRAGRSFRRWKPAGELNGEVVTCRLFQEGRGKLTAPGPVLAPQLARLGSLLLCLRAWKEICLLLTR